MHTGFFQTFELGSEKRETFSFFPFLLSLQLVPTIDTLTPVSAQELDSKMTQSKTVSLFLPDKGEPRLP